MVGHQSSTTYSQLNFTSVQRDDRWFLLCNVCKKSSAYSVVMLKYRKNLVSLLVPYNITIQEISDKFKKLFERNVRNVLETLITNFLSILIMIS